MELNFSTEGIPERDRLAHWREVFAETIANLEWYPLFDGAIEQKAKVYRLPELGLFVGRNSRTGFVIRRTPKLISRGRDDLVLTIQIDGHFGMSQLGRDVQIGPGEAVLSSTSDVVTARVTPNSQNLALSVPRSRLAPMVPQLQDHVGVVLSKHSEPVRMLTSYIPAVLNAGAVINPQLQGIVTSHIYDLVALALTPKREIALDLDRRGLAAARISAIKADMLANLADNQLTESAIARRHRVTPRYIRRLFASEGMTFSDFLRRSRAARAHQILTDFRSRGRTISSIAYEVGFNDLSHFNRLFRHLYGGSPSEIRATHVALRHSR
jgi:AraC-like DNA-binding protein